MKGGGGKSSLLQSGQVNGTGASLTLVLSCDFQRLGVAACAGPASHFCAEALKSCSRDGH